MEVNSVLVIDDETANIIALTGILSPLYNVLAAKNGTEAIIVANEHLPDVILLDVLMPDMDGYEVLSVLKSDEKTKNIPVIFITGLDSADAESKGLALGAADYIIKPFGSDVVKLRVQNQIKIVNHIRTLEERDELERQLNIIKELEAGLIEAKEQAEHSRGLAEHSSRAKSEFLARMSHEMRTPMNAIMGMLQLIKARGIPENLKSYLEKITVATDHLLHMINDVLDVSGMEYGIFTLSNEPFKTNEVFQEVLEAAQYNASLKNQQLDYSFDTAIPETLVGDGKRLNQVLTNLLANAVKFTPELGNISFYVFLLSKNDSDNSVILQFEVTDNGIGISQEQQRSLFQLFEQLDGSNTRKHGGIGIGLALSKSIIERMGGEMFVESEPEKGAKFTFTCNFEMHKS